MNGKEGGGVRIVQCRGGSESENGKKLMRLHMFEDKNIPCPFRLV